MPVELMRCLLACSLLGPVTTCRSRQALQLTTVLVALPPKMRDSSWLGRFAPSQVGDLSIIHRCFHGNCSQEIRDIIPIPLRRVRTTRSSTHSRPFQVSLPNPRTLSHKSSFLEHAIYGTSCLPFAFLNLTTCHLLNPSIIKLN